MVVDEINSIDSNVAIVEESEDSIAFNLAKDLLENVKMLCTLKDYKVPNPANPIQVVSIDQYMNIMRDFFEFNGKLGIESSFFEVIRIINEQMLIMNKRIDESMRMLLKLYDKKDITIDKLKDIIEKKNNKIEEWEVDYKELARKYNSLKDDDLPKSPLPNDDLRLAMKKPPK